jgi:hypothetical protein
MYKQNADAIKASQYNQYLNPNHPTPVPQGVILKSVLDTPIPSVPRPTFAPSRKYSYPIPIGYLNRYLQCVFPYYRHCRHLRDRLRRILRRGI